MEKTNVARYRTPKISAVLRVELIWIPSFAGSTRRLAPHQQPRTRSHQQAARMTRRWELASTVIRRPDDATGATPAHEGASTRSTLATRRTPLTQPPGCSSQASAPRPAVSQRVFQPRTAKVKSSRRCANANSPTKSSASFMHRPGVAGQIGPWECPRICVGMTERKRHAFILKRSSS